MTKLIGDVLAAVFVLAVVFVLARPQSAAADAVRAVSDGLAALVRSATDL